MTQPPGSALTRGQGEKARGREKRNEAEANVDAGGRALFVDAAAPFFT